MTAKTHIRGNRRLCFYAAILAFIFGMMDLSATAQTMLPIPGLYSGKVNRNRNNGPALETRTYRMRLNDDLATGTVDVYELDGTFIAHLDFAGRTDGEKFVGRTNLRNAPPDYLPDNILLNFGADHKSVEWRHSDGNIQGSGVLYR
jgi:hypothetical protein